MTSTPRHLARSITGQSGKSMRSGWARTGIWSIAAPASRVAVKLLLAFIIVLSAPMLPGGGSAAAQTPSDGDLRLQGGDSATTGRLEIYYNDEWGAVCDDRFGAEEVAVAVRQLGFADGLQVPNRLPTPSSLKIWLDDVSCTGSESRLNECSSSPIGVHNCYVFLESVVLSVTAASSTTLRFLRAEHGDSELVLFWHAPLDQNGQAIRDASYEYRYKADGDTFSSWANLAAEFVRNDEMTATVGNLSNGTSYAVQVRAVRNHVAGDAASVTGTPVPGFLLDTNTALSVADAEATEGDDATLDFVVTLRLSGPGPSVTVDYATADGTATAGDDYTATSGTLTFGPGETTKTIAVPIMDDTVEDDGETILLTLSNASGAAIVDAEATGTIRNTEEEPETSDLSVADVEATEGADATLDFVVMLGPAADGTVTVEYATSDGTATEGQDYTETSGTLTFAPGDTEKTIAVPVLEDTVEDDGETLTLTLSNVAGAELAEAEATGTIRNTEAPVPNPLTARFTHLSSAHDGEGAFTFRVEFSEEVGISYKTLRDESFSVTNGDVTRARRVDGRHDLWEITVEPDSREAVAITLPGGRDCGTTGAVCTRGDDPRPLSNSPSATVAGPVVTNTLPTGAPTISGTARVGETLTASVVEIADTDGLTGASYGHQWIANDGTADAEIQGATNSTYTLAAADAGKTVKVRVSFTDDGGTEETLLSTATDSVEGTLTAAFEGMPAEHDGSSVFTFRARFDPEPRVSYKVLRDQSFQVTGGTVRRARRVNGGNSLREIHVEPSGYGDVTITLAGGRACGTRGAICTANGKVLSNTLTATVRGPAALTVADARAEEGVDETIDFAVTLSRAASGTVTVDYATANGTATLGQDYTAASGTLTFASGETSKTVSVPVLDDAIDEGEETFTLTLSNASGAAIEDGEAVGTIANSDPLQKMWLSRFGRTVASHVVDAVSERLSGRVPGSQVTVGGQTIDLSRFAGAAEPEAWRSRAPGAQSHVQGTGLNEPGTWSGTHGGLGTEPSAGSGALTRTLSGRELLLGSSFHMAADGDRSGPALAAWGRVMVGGFDAEAPAERGQVCLDGEVTTGILGADAEWGRVLAGVSVSVSEGEGTFDQPGVDQGKLESSLTGVHPYLRMAVSERVSAWGLLGYGMGDMTITQVANENRDEVVTRTDIEMRLGAAGARGVLVEADESGGFDLALRGDAFLVEMESKKAANTVATKAGASRLRLVLEGSRSFETGGGGWLTPALELGLRHDGGDAETGTGVEVGGSVRYADPGSGLSIEASARTLVAHEESGFEEWGASASVRLDPSASGRGLSLRIVPSLGAPSSGLDRLWSAGDAADLAGYGEFDAQQRLEAEVGYGLGGPSGLGVVTPYAGLGLASRDGRSWRAGARWQLAPTVSLGFEGTRLEAANDEAPEHGLMLRGSVQW